MVTATWAEDDGDIPELSPKEFMAILQEKLPEAVAELDALKADGEQEEFIERREDLRNATEYYLYLKQISPEAAENMLTAQRLEYKASDLQGKYFEAENNDEKDAMKGQINDILGELFDLRLSESLFEAEQLRIELEEIERLIKKRQSSRERIIAKRLEEMTDTNEDQDWW